MIAYEITNTVNGKRYIGITAGTVANRWAQHKAASLNVRKRRPLLAAIRRYGCSAFTIREVASAVSRPELKALEVVLIAQEATRAPFGYNMTAGGDGTSGLRSVRFIDLSGRTFERLLVTGQAGVVLNSDTVYSCLCECGGTIKVRGGALRCGATRSCGCLEREVRKTNIQSATTHGMTRTTTYRSWCGIVEAGSPVCEIWHSFEQFLLDMGERPRATRLFRLDKNKPYGPGNAAWVSPQQAANQRKSNVHYEVDGRSYTLAELARIYDIKIGTLWFRLKAGWPINRSIRTPVKVGIGQ